jgi:hypothetical protein
VTYEIVLPRVQGLQLNPLRPARLDTMWLVNSAEP